jgi:hypothetical protein
MLHDPAAGEYWGQLYERFAEFQFVVFYGSSSQPVGVGNSVPLAWYEDLF